jgi:hypothetical protein
LGGQVWDWGETASNYYITADYRITIDVSNIVNFVKLHIYRREKTSGWTNKSRYYGLSQFEHIEITAAELIADNYKIRLRPPLHSSMFSSDPAATTATDYSLLSSTYSQIGGSYTFRPVRYISQGATELYLVAESSAGIGTKAVFLNEGGKILYKTTTNLLLQNGAPYTIDWPSGVDTAVDYGWRRRSTESTSTVAANKLRLSFDSPPNNGSDLTKYVTFASISGWPGVR